MRENAWLDSCMLHHGNRVSRLSSITKERLFSLFHLSLFTTILSVSLNLWHAESFHYKTLIRLMPLLNSLLKEQICKRERICSAKNRKITYWRLAASLHRGYVQLTTNDSIKVGRSKRFSALECSKPKSSPNAPIGMIEKIVAKSNLSTLERDR